MKIIGHTPAGYIVEMSDGEVNRAAGFPSDHSPPWKKDSFGYYKPDSLAPIGTEIRFVEPTTRLRALVLQEDKIKQNAGMLRTLADMLETLVPSEIIAPEGSGEASE